MIENITIFEIICILKSINLFFHRIGKMADKLPHFLVAFHLVTNVSLQ